MKTYRVECKELNSVYTLDALIVVAEDMPVALTLAETTFQAKWPDTALRLTSIIEQPEEVIIQTRP